MRIAAMLFLCTVVSFQPVTAIESDDDRIYRMLVEVADEWTADLKASGVLVEDEQLSSYLQDILSKQYPRNPALRVYVIEDYEPNAFVLPNGTVVMHSGMLGLLRNEAQIAEILGHEGGHYLERHSVRNYLNLRELSDRYFRVNSRRWWDLLREATEYNREQELEADNHGVKRLIEQGYSLNEGAVNFVLSKEFDDAFIARDEDEDDLFRIITTHPSPQERFEAFQDVAKEAGVDGSGIVNTDAYHHATRAVGHAVVKHWRSYGADKVMRVLLADPLAPKRYGPEYYFYVSELFRLGTSEEEKKQVMPLLVRALSAGADDPEVLFAMARYRRMEDNNQVARNFFTRFVAAAGTGHLRSGIARYLGQAPEQREPETYIASKSTPATRVLDRRERQYQYELSVPDSWRFEELSEGNGFWGSKEGAALGKVVFYHTPLKDEYEAQFRDVPATLDILALSDVMISNIVRGHPNWRFLDSRPINLDGHEAMEYEFESIGFDGIRIRHKYIGAFDNGLFYEFRYEAPTEVYFQRYLQDFNDILARFVFRRQVQPE